MKRTTEFFDSSTGKMETVVEVTRGHPVSDAPTLPNALESVDVLAVLRDTREAAESAGVGSADRAMHEVTQLLRRGSAITRNIQLHEANERVEMEAIRRFHASYYDKFKASLFLVESAVKSLRPLLPFGKKKTIQTPYGSVGYKETNPKGDQIRLQVDQATGKKDALADALVDRWCVVNDIEGTRVAKIVPLTDDELKALRANLRAAMADDPLVMLPEEFVIERLGATELKAIAKATGELPDGFEITPFTVTDVVTFDGIASPAVDALDVEFDDDQRAIAEAPQQAFAIGTVVPQLADFGSFGAMLDNLQDKHETSDDE